MTPDIADFPEVATEAIVVVDLTESASTSNLFGWYAVGRSLMRDLRSMIHEVGDTRGLPVPEEYRRRVLACLS